MELSFICSFRELSQKVEIVTWSVAILVLTHTCESGAAVMWCAVHVAKCIVCRPLSRALYYKLHIVHFVEHCV